MLVRKFETPPFPGFWPIKHPFLYLALRAKYIAMVDIV